MHKHSALEHKVQSVEFQRNGQNSEHGAVLKFVPTVKKDERGAVLKFIPTVKKTNAEPVTVANRNRDYARVGPAFVLVGQYHREGPWRPGRV